MGKLLSGHIARRFGHLLDMLYTPAELAQEVGIDKRLVYGKLLPAGLPSQKDNSGRIWIHGKTAAAWVKALPKKVHVKLAPGEGYCRKCKKAVPMADPREEVKNRIRYLIGVCGTCGRRMFRITGKAQ